jgi:peptidoglycan LD-endopeptidase LytH
MLSRNSHILIFTYSHILSLQEHMSSIRPSFLVSLLLLSTGCEQMVKLDAWRDARRGRQVPQIVTPAPASPDAPTPAVVDTSLSMPVEPIAVKTISDNSAVASELELAALSAMLVVPVAGVKPSQLRDSYAEARGSRIHEAMDILAPRGTPVVSAVDGRLLKLFDSKAGGLMVYATDPSGRFILLYGHLDKYAPGLTNGMLLKRGQVIGYVGTSGNAPPGTPHLHFGILRGEPSVSWSKGSPVNPYLLYVPPAS